LNTTRNLELAALPAADGVARRRAARGAEADLVTMKGLLRYLRTAPRAGRHGVHFADGESAGRHQFLPWAVAIETAERLAMGLRIALAEDLREQSTSPHENPIPPRVALVFPTGPDFFSALFACWLAEFLPAPLYPPQRFAPRGPYVERTSILLQECGANLVLCDPRYLAVVGAAAKPSHEESASDPPCLTLEQIAQKSPPEGAQPASAEGNSTCPEVGPDEARAGRAGEGLALVQFSSGTTGVAKPIALSHRALLAQGHLLSACWPEREGQDQSGVSWLPLYHDMGLIGCVLPSLLRAADLTLLRPETFVSRPARWLQTLSETRATVSPAPNFAYEYCLKKIPPKDLEGLDLSAWQTALNGAETVSGQTLRLFLERFAPYGFSPCALTPAYGLAEAALAVTMAPLGRPPTLVTFDRARLAGGDVRPIATCRLGEEPEQLRDRQQANEAVRNANELELVALGPPLPGFEISIRRSELAGDWSETEGVGRVWIRGPSLLSGVLRRNEEDQIVLENALEDGWLDTGDVGFLWRHELYLVGRARDVLIVRGRNWPAQWIEQMACQDSRVEAAIAVASMAAAGDREEVFLFLETRAPAEDHADLATVVHGLLAAAAGIRADHVLLTRPGAMPRTSSGKLRRAAALEAWRAGNLAGVHREPR
jgi:acyl-CoA synthetase (AMP-forming)/AMP-acid ligase II